MSSRDDSPAFPPVTFDDWRRRVLAELGGGTLEERLGRRTLEGIPVEPLYTAAAGEGAPELPRVARAPGPWRLWQEVPASAGAAGAAALAREADRDLAGVWLRPDDPAALTAARLGELLAQVPLERVEVAMDGSADPLAQAALLVAATAGAGAGPAGGGCLGCDPLGALARTGAARGDGLDQLADAARWAVSHGPGWRAALVSTAPYHDAGADAVQELAFALATAREVLGQLLASGLSGDEAAGQLLFSVPVGRDFYLQVAKLRALRVLGALAFDAVGAGPERLRLHARTSWRTRVRLDPATDLVRVTVEAMAAVVGGCDDLTCAPFLDPALELELGLPLGSATQLLLRDEAGLGRVADPLGGSWYVERLTAELAHRAWELAAEIDRCGGMSRVLGVGLVERWVEAAADARLRALARRELPITGVSSYPTAAPTALPYRPRGVRAEAPAAPPVTPAATPQVDAGAAGDFATLVSAATAGAPLAALAAVAPAAGRLRATPLQPWRDAVPFETLRRLGARAPGDGGAHVAALLRLAPPAATIAETAAAREVALACGLEPREVAAASAEEAAAAWRQTAAPVAVLVPSRRTPRADVSAAATALRRAGCGLVLAVGPAAAGGDADAGEGPDLWIEPGGDLLALLRAVVGRLRAAATAPAPATAGGRAS